jgi:hypothetical protein
MTAVVLLSITAVTAGCTSATTPEPISTTPLRFSDNSHDDRDLNNEAFDLIWWEMTHNSPGAATALCISAQVQTAASWQTFDNNTGHVFPRTAWLRGIYRHCP